MKRKFMEGLKKFTAIFVLIQMALVLFPAPVALAAEKEDKKSIDNIYIKNLETNTSTEVTTGFELNLNDYEAGKIALAVDVTSNSQNNCVQFNLNGALYNAESIRFTNDKGNAIYENPVFQTGANTLVVELFNSSNCSDNARVTRSLNFTATGALTIPLIAPTLISPANNTVVDGAEVTNKWSAVNGATGYVYESYHDEDLTNLRYTNQYTETEKTAYNVSDAVFWWRVKAKNATQESPWSDTWKLTIENINDIETLAAPNLISPVDNAVVNGAEVTNKWSAVNGATGYVYESYHDENLTNLRYTNQYTETEKTAYNVSDAVLWWRVKAVNANQESLWSDAWKLTIDNTLPEAPVISGFKNPTLSCGAITNINYTTVNWNDVPGALNYLYEIDYPKPDGERGVWKTTKDISEHSGDLFEGVHYIRVKSYFGDGVYSDWSNTCSITADWTAPISSVNELPQETTAKKFDINITAEDDVAVDYVELWYRHEGSEWKKYEAPVENSTYSLDVSYSFSGEFDPNETILFDTFLTGGDGFYEFYSIAFDKAGNKEEKLQGSEAFITVFTPSDDNGNGENGNGDENGDNGEGPDGTDGETGPGGETPTGSVLTPVTTVAFAAPETLPTEQPEEQDVSSETTDDEEGDILGEEDEEGNDERQCAWWWIILVILGLVLTANYYLHRKYHDNENLKKFLMVTPVVFGLIAIWAHNRLAAGLDLVGICNYIWLLVAIMVGAYYPVKNYLDKEQTQK